MCPHRVVTSVSGGEETGSVKTVMNKRWSGCGRQPMVQDACMDQKVFGVR
jgi:hypothetical protein